MSASDYIAIAAFLVSVFAIFISIKQIKLSNKQTLQAGRIESLDFLKTNLLMRCDAIDNLIKLPYFAQRFKENPYLLKTLFDCEIFDDVDTDRLSEKLKSTTELKYQYKKAIRRLEKYELQIKCQWVQEENSPGMKAANFVNAYQNLMVSIVDVIVTPTTENEKIVDAAKQDLKRAYDVMAKPNAKNMRCVVEELEAEIGFLKRF